MLRINGYATVFNIDIKDNYTKAGLRTARKDKRTDEYITSFFNAKFVGDAHTKVQLLQEKDKIKITEFGVSNEEYGKEKKRWNEVIIFNFEMQSQAKSDNVSWDKLESVDDDEGLPF